MFISIRLYCVVISIILLLPAVLQGQQAMITVIDDITGETVPYAHVCFEAIDADEQEHCVSGIDGEVPNKVLRRSLIAISYIGFTTLHDTILPGQSYKFRLKPSIQSIDEVVVTAQYAPEKADKSIYKVKVIGSREIEQKAAANLTELLNTETNLRLSQDGALGTSLTMRGLSGEHIKFLVDGVPVIGRMNGNIDISQLNLYNVDHIEIIEGPMSVVYGSNALAGVVNIITKENKNRKVTANANAYVESVGIYNFDGGVSAKFGKHLVSLSGGRNFFDGYSYDDTLRSVRWKPKRQFFMDGYYIFGHENVKLKLSSSFFNEKLQSKGNLLAPYYESAFDSYFYTTRFTNKLDVSTKWNNKRYMNIFASWAYYGRIKETYYKDMTTLEEVPTTNPADYDTTTFNSFLVRGTYSKSNESSTLNYQIGFDINLEVGEGKRITDQKQQMGDYAAFFSLKWEPFRDFIIQPGLRYIYNTRYQAPLVYSLNLKYNFAKQFAVRASYARGFRAPSLKELYLYFVDVNHNVRGNEELEAEDSHNFNFVFSFNRESGKTFSGVELSLFYNNINNTITLAQVSGDLYTYINVDKYITQGLQFNYISAFTRILRLTAGLGITGRYNSLAEQAEGINKVPLQPGCYTYCNLQSGEMGC